MFKLGSQTLFRSKAIYNFYSSHSNVFLYNKQMGKWAFNVVDVSYVSNVIVTGTCE